MLKKYLLCFLVSMVPLIELRGGVPIAVGAAVYGGLCLLLWIKTNNRAILRLVPGLRK